MVIKTTSDTLMISVLLQTTDYLDLRFSWSGEKCGKCIIGLCLLWPMELNKSCYKKEVMGLRSTR